MKKSLLVLTAAAIGGACAGFAAEAVKLFVAGHFLDVVSEREEEEEANNDNEDEGCGGCCGCSSEDLSDEDIEAIILGLTAAADGTRIFE